MGAGDIFRGVAQALMGAGGGAAQDALAAQRKGGLMSPLEEEKIRAEINALNRKGTGDGRTGKQKLLLIYNQKTGRYRSEVAPTEAGETIQLQPGERLLTGGGTGFNVNPSGEEQFYDPTNFQQLMNSVGRGGNVGQPPPAPSPVPAPTPSRAPLPTRKPGETQAQYSARTGIKFK